MQTDIGHHSLTPNSSRTTRRGDHVQTSTDLLCAAGLTVAGGALLTALALNGVLLCLSLVSTLLTLLDFRIGVVLLILLMPI